VSLGRHDVEIRYRSKPDANFVLARFANRQPQIEIQAGSGGVAQPAIKSVFPLPAYPKEGGGAYDDLRIQGEGFARDACDNEVAL
jgi:hypothetical protein